MAFHWLSFSLSISSTSFHNKFSTQFFIQIFHANFFYRIKFYWEFFMQKFSYNFSVKISVQLFTFGGTFGRNFFYRFSVELSVQTFGPKFGRKFSGDLERKRPRGASDERTVRGGYWDWPLAALKGLIWSPMRGSRGVFRHYQSQSRYDRRWEGAVAETARSSFTYRVWWLGYVYVMTAGVWLEYHASYQGCAVVYFVVSMSVAMLQ